MDKKCFVFDLDGTLLDTLKTINYYLSKILTDNGFLAVSEEACRDFVGDGSKILLARALKAQGESDSALVNKMCCDYVSSYNANPYYLTIPYNGIRELLSTLKERGVRLAILSNKPHSSVVPIVEHFFPKIFEAVQGAEDGLALKPSPGLLLKIAEKLAVLPEECVFVGDSGVDMQTAKNAGALAVGVLWGFRSEEELREAGADALVTRAEEISKIY